MRAVRSLVTLLALCLIATPVLAEVDGPTSEFIRAPMSVRQQGGGALYGSTEVFKIFANPALLSFQERTWEVGTSDMILWGGAENYFSIAGSWAGAPGDMGTFGAAVMYRMISMESFAGMDVFGNPTGLQVEPSASHIGVAGLYQYQFASLGVALQQAMSTYGNLPQINTNSRTTVDLGTVIRLGRLDFGVSYRISGEAGMSQLGLGGAARFTGFFKGSVGVDATLPFAPTAQTGIDQKNVKAYPAAFGFGATWNAHPMLDARVGTVINGSDTSARAGISAHWKAYSLDYAMALPVSGPGIDLEMTHMIGLGWAFGKERKPPEAPRFFMKAEERTLAVSNFDPQNVSAGDAAVISDMLRNQLVREGAFNIVEKANMDKVLGEQAFQQTGCTTQECAVKLGKILNVKYLVVGSFGKALDQYVLSMRVIDVETAKAVYSDETYGKNLQEIRDGITAISARLTEAVKKAR
ncbi:MAG: CsgG/HfaB family protein [Candidatus Coatesbacteria bacterium]